MSRVMGIDAGTESTGVAIFDTDKNDFIHISRIRTSIKKATPTNGKRREYICAELSHLMLMECVDVVLIEDIYVQNKVAAIPLGALRGAIEQTVYDMEYEHLHVIETKKVKKAVTGKGNSSKLDVYLKLKEIYAHSPIVMDVLGEELISNKAAEKNEDMSDAIALVHAYLTDSSLAHYA